MSKHKRKQQHKPQLATSSSEQQAYRELARLIEKAQTVAGPGRAADLTEAGRLLSSNPQLVRYLQAAQEREYARQDALHRLDVKAAPTGSSPQAGMAGWTGTRNYPQGVPNARLLRDWADSNEWTRAAINVRRQQIERADIAVMPLNERKPYNRPAMKSLQQLLDQPNELRDSWRSLIGPVIEDLLVLDRGVISKNMTMNRKPVSLYYEDGATIKIFPQWSGDPSEPRYLYEEPGGSNKKPLRNDEAIVMMANGASYRFGLSPVQVLRATIIADIEAGKSAAHLVSMKPPPAALQIPGATDTQLRSLMSAYDQEIAGRKELFFFGGDKEAKLFPLMFSAKDQQWMEWQEYLARKICAVFQISPQQIGLTFDINKSTANVQQDISEDIGLIPIFLLLEEYLNRELVADFAPRMAGDRANLDALNLRIVFPEVTEASRMMHAQRAIEMAAQSLAGLPSQTPNEVRMAMGLEPIPGGNTLWTKIATGPVPWLSYDNETGAYGPMSTSGELGAQDPAGGIDESGDVADGDDSPVQDDSGGNGDTTPSVIDAPNDVAAAASDATQPATKHMLVRDMRRPGVKWSPSVVQRDYEPDIAKAAKGKPLPKHALSTQSVRDDQAQKVLHDAVQRVFAEAAQRGQRALEHRQEGV